jgi:Xaa-Pro aminopeptidase
MVDTYKLLEGRRIGNIPTLGRQWNDWDDRLDVRRMKKDRLKKAQEAIAKAGLGAILCYDLGNMRYLGAPPYQQWARNRAYQYVLVPRKGDPYFFSMGTRMPQIRDEIMTSWGGKVRGCHEVEWTLMGGGTADHFVKGMKELLYEYGVEKEPFGIDKPQYSVNLKEMFKKEGIDLVDGMVPMMAARLIKTQDEIYCLNMAANIAEVAFEAIRANIRPGVLERDLMAEGMKAAMQAGAESAAEFVICSGERGNRNMLNFTDKPVRPGEMVFADAAGLIFMGYYTCYYRDFCCGKPTQQQKEMYAECLEMLYKALKKIKPGVSSADVVKEWPTCDYWGLQYEHEGVECFVCHGIGCGIHEGPLVHRMASLTNPITFQEGMVCAIETWVGRENPRMGARIEEEFVITKDGAEIISKWPVAEITECWI